MTHLLFVYGTLSSSSLSQEARRLAAGSTHLGTAWTRGELQDLHGFPALVQTGAGRVDGELLHVRDAGLWAELDAYEGVGEGGWYRRQLVIAIDASDQPRSCWTYVAHHSPRPRPVGS